MPDYRQDLSFGVFVTPLAAQADAVVELARLADVLGLDLVSFQDHPYQPSFLETWTLLSVVAAATTNVRVAPNVANLPLRPPPPPDPPCPAQRPHPAATPARRPRPQRGEPRPAQRRPRRAGPRRRRVL